MTRKKPNARIYFFIKKGTIELVKSIAKSNPRDFTLYFFIFIDLIFLTKIVGGSALLTVFFLFLSTLALCIKLNDAVSGFMLMTIFTLQFYVPNKYYTVEVFRPADLINGLGSYLLSYGINLKNIFLLITVLLIIRNVLLKKTLIKKKKIVFVMPVIISGIVFFLVSLYSSLNFSPYINLSFFWLMHYMQMFLLAFVILYVFKFKPNNFKAIIQVIFASIFLQSIVSILQFVKQSWAGLPIESAQYSNVYYGAPDAVSSLFRVAGTFGQSNQFGLIMLVMLALVIPTTIEIKKPIYVFSCLTSVAMVLLTESRSAWISLIGLTFFLLIMFKKELLNFSNKFGVKRIIYISSMIILSTAFVVVPRLLGSLNAFTEGAAVPLRTAMVKEAGLAIQQNFWIGYGVGTNETVLLNLFPLGYNYRFPAPVHMAYIQLILESGILGFVSLLFPFIYIIRSILNLYFRSGWTKMNGLKNYIFITLSGVIIFGLFYLFQPHEGTREFYYLGIILAYGMISIPKAKRFKL